MSKFIGDVSAYAYAVSKGYTGTEEEFAELMASYAEVGQTAVDAAESALDSKTAAQTAATTATNKASEATTAAQTATTKAGVASQSASQAGTSAQTASTKASEASQSASKATEKATEATTAASNATTAKDDAVTAKNAAQTARDKAETAQGKAEDAAESVSASAAQIQTNKEDISELKSDLTDKADQTDMLKAFPTDTASGAVASFADGANVPVKSLIVNIDPVQEGSGDPSPTNVRPISGWSEVNVGVSGKNLFDSNFSDYTKPYNYYICPIKLENGKRYKLKAELVGTTITGASFGLVKSGNRYEEFVGTFFVIGSNGDAREFNITVDDTFTAPKLIAYVSGENQFNEVLSNYNVMLMPHEQADYEPYSGTSINIALGQAVYGGKLDVTKGELRLVTGYKSYDSCASLASNGNLYYATFVLPDTSHASSVTNPAVVCNMAKDNGQVSALGNCYCISNGVTVVAVLEQSYTTKTLLDAYLAENPLQLVFDLANPITVQLTPHEVTALLGDNNIWADSGDSEVTYRADPTLYIGRLTEPDADMVADSNITSGQYFMVGNTLYKATANIASGATISPNVNCTRKSLSEALNEINA